MENQQVISIGFGKSLRKSVTEKQSLQIAGAEEIKKGWGDYVNHPADFATLRAYHTPAHDRCITVKAQTAFGQDWTGDDSLVKNDWGETPRDTVAQFAEDLVRTGNGYLEVAQAASNKTRLYWMPSHTMVIHKNRKTYRQKIGDSADYREWPAFGMGNASENSILHVRLPHIWSVFYGGPDYLGAEQSIMLWQDSTEWNRSFFSNNCVPPTILYLTGKELSTKNELDADGNRKLSEAEELQNGLKSNFSGASNAHKILLLHSAKEGGKLEVQHLTQGVKDGEFSKQRADCRDEIITAHGVPPRLAGVITNGGLGGKGELYGQLVMFKALCVKPLQQIVADSFNDSFLQGQAGIDFGDFDIEWARESGVQQVNTDQVLEQEVARMEKMFEERIRKYSNA